MILVTGCAGVLGEALFAQLQRQYEGVIGIRRGDVSLEDPAATLAFFRHHRPTMVFHAAARVHGLMGNTKHPCDIFTENVRINTNVVEAARLTDCEKVIGVSTVAAYPDTRDFPIKEAVFWQGPPHASERAYGQSKRAMLAHLEGCKAQYGMDFLYPICTNLFGPHDRFDEMHGHVVPSLISKFHRAVHTGSEVEVWGSGNARRDFMFAPDAAAAIILASRTASGPINIATGKTLPVRDLVQGLADITGVTNIRWDVSKPDGQLDRSYDVGGLRQLGFAPAHNLQEGLRLTWDWYVSVYPDVRR